MLNNTAVDNLCDAILLAMEKPGILGETFNIRDERLVTREEFINTVADYLGKPHPRHVPEWVGRALVGPIEAIARLRGRQTPPLLTRAQIKFMTLNLDFSIAKAKRMLGYRPRVDFRDGIVAALDSPRGRRRRSARRRRLFKQSANPSTCPVFAFLMRIRQLTAYVVRLPLKRPFTHASATRQESENVLVRCELADGTTGWGEGVPRSYVTGETPDGCLAQLAATPLAEQLGGRLQLLAGCGATVRAVCAGRRSRRSARLLWQRAAVRRGAQHSRCVRPAIRRARVRRDVALSTSGSDSHAA